MRGDRPPLSREHPVPLLPSPPLSVEPAHARRDKKTDNSLELSVQVEKHLNLSNEFIAGLKSILLFNNYLSKRTRSI